MPNKAIKVTKAAKVWDLPYRAAIKSATEVIFCALDTNTILRNMPKPKVKIRMGPIKMGKKDQRSLAD